MLEDEEEMNVEAVEDEIVEPGDEPAEVFDELVEDDDDEFLPVADDVEGETAMRQMIDYIARALVEDTDAVQVDSTWRDDRLIVNLKVAETDKGKVIGRNGRVVQAMQSLLRVAATKSNLRVNLDVE